jgi:hypothetical protein
VFEVPNGQLGWYPKIAFKFAEQLEVMLTYSPCVMVVRVDLRMNNYTEKNKVMTTFFRRFGKRLKRRYAALNLGHVWIREQAIDNSKQHYHLTIMVDKNLIHYSRTITDAVIEVWKGITGGQAHIPDNCYYVVKRGCWQSFADAFGRVCYLAKVSTKGSRPAQTKGLGSSRLKKRLIKT